MTIRRPRTGTDGTTNKSIEARFTPGTVLAERYRIINPLGRGGMGEVFRAEDLKLGQPVALKFLPQRYTKDEDWLKRLHDEVRIARGIAHPNVCRTYDIGDAEGEHFITMEYVDGEDLSSLLTRIDRLPHDKAVKFARQLCAGLAAAHDRGVLHRDLKPANIMIDGRGNARITDFGIAALVDELGDSSQRAGTPAYMAPEQLAGDRVSTRSDVFSLGLVLYELFTGKPVYDGLTAPEIRAQHETTSTTSMSSLLPDIDPAVERVIERCLEKDERRRPKSALEVAAALPGGDPLAMALAAGETPSPEMVAAAGEEGLLNPKWSLALLVIILLAMGNAMFRVFSTPADESTRLGRMVLDMPFEPAVLAQRCREYIEQLGYHEPARDSMYGFGYIDQYQQYLIRRDDGPDRWDPLQIDRPPLTSFWYRRSDGVIRPVQTDVSIRGVTAFNPPVAQTGNMAMSLDPQGRLYYFWAQESWGRGVDAPSNAEAAGVETDWDLIFTLTELDAVRFEPVEPSFLPSLVFDTRRAWAGTWSDDPEAQVRIEASSFRGRIVGVRLVYPFHDDWDATTATGTTERSADPVRLAQMSQLIFSMIEALVLVGGLVLALRNLRMGRGDRRGAFRMALFALVMHELYWLFSISRLPLVIEGIGADFRLTLGTSLYHALLMGVMYLALEPYVRRWWPKSIIGWTRLLSGRWRDPIVGRDILIGMATICGTLFVIGTLFDLGRELLGIPESVRSPDVAALSGLREILGISCRNIMFGTYVAMLQLLFILLFGVLTRRIWVGFLIAWITFTLISQAGTSDTHAWHVLAMSVFNAVFLLLLVRYGLLAAAVGWAILFVSFVMPFGRDIGDWNSAPFLFTVALAVVVSLFGYWTSLAGRPIFGDSLNESPP